MTYYVFGGTLSLTQSINHLLLLFYTVHAVTVVYIGNWIFQQLAFILPIDWCCMLSGYNADIICLQEVDKKVFERDLCPRLEELGLTGLLRLKFGDVHEGSAIFFRNERFK